MPVGTTFILACRDGGIDATINHEQSFMSSKEVMDIYSTEEPQAAFHARVAFCLDIHNEVFPYSPPTFPSPPLSCPSLPDVVALGPPLPSLMRHNVLLCSLCVSNSVHCLWCMATGFTVLCVYVLAYVYQVKSMCNHVNT